MKPDEQVHVARELVDQSDKQAVRDPRKFETRIRAVVKERRESAREKNAETRRTQSDPVKGLFRAIDSIEASVKSLVEVDLTAISEIDAADKGNALKRLYDVVEGVTTFTDDRLAKLTVRKTAA